MAKQKQIIEARVAPRFVGIGAAASVLGVSSNHLRKVLRGERQSNRLRGMIERKFPGLLAFSK